MKAYRAYITVINYCKLLHIKRDFGILNASYSQQIRKLHHARRQAGVCHTDKSFFKTKHSTVASVHVHPRRALLSEKLNVCQIETCQLFVLFSFRDQGHTQGRVWVKVIHARILRGGDSANPIKVKHGKMIPKPVSITEVF